MADPRTPPAPEPSSVPTTPDGRVLVRTTTGDFASVPESQVEAFLAEGRGVVATPDEAVELGKEKAYGRGIGNELTAGAEAAADAATLGAYSVGRRVIGGEEAATATRERRERNPLAATTGTLAGIGAVALATGGSGALGAVARATPAGAAIRLGMAAEQSIAGASALSRIGALTASGALEGAVFGLGEGVSDAALSEDQRDRMAEHLMVDLSQRAGQGALFGALGGAATGAGLEALRGLSLTARKLVTRTPIDEVGDVPGTALARRQADELALSGSTGEAGAEGETLSSAMARTRGRSGADFETSTTIRLGRPGEERDVLKEFGEAATARNRFDGVQQQATDRITKLASENARAADDLMAEANVGLKKNPVRRLFEADPPASIDAALETSANVLAKIDDELAAEVAKGQARYSARGLQAFDKARAELEAIANDIKIPRDADSMAEMYIGLDRLKRRLGRVQKWAGSGMQGDDVAQQIIRRHYEELRSLLENADTFGSGVTRMQKEVNAAWSQYLDYAQAYEKRFTFQDGMRVTRSARDGFDKVADADPAKVGAFLKGAGDAEAAAAERDLIEGVRLQGDLLDTLAKHYDVSEGLKSQVSRARRNAAEIADEVARVKKVRTQADQWERMISGLRDVPMVGGFLSGTVTTTGRAVASAEAASRVVALARIRANARAGASAVTKAVRRVVDGSSQALRTTGSLSGTVAQKAKDFGRIYTAVREYEKDPAAAVRRTYRLHESLGTVAPLLAAAYAAKTNAAASFLSAKLPRHDVPDSVFDRVDESKPPKVSSEELDAFMRYARAVENPLSVVDDLERGTVSPEAVEAIRTVYPGLYQQMQTEILDELAEAKDPPPYHVRLSLGQLFDITTDPSLDPEFLGMLQASAQASMPADAVAQASQAPLSPSRRSAPDTAGLAETKSQAFQRAR